MPLMKERRQTDGKCSIMAAMREIFSFFIIPFLAVRFNYYTCIAPAGATSEDTTLPMMLKYTNEETVVLSVLNGIICSFFVPILIALFLGTA